MRPGFKLLISLVLLAFSIVLVSMPVLAHEEHEHLHVLIDIKPGSDPNVINLKNNGVVPVALFGSEFMDVHNVDTATVMLGRLHHHEGGAHSIKVTSEDVDQDGVLDLVFFFATNDLRKVLDTSDTVACLHGSLLTGAHFCGHDAVSFRP